MRKRSVWVEPLFGEAKEFHRLRRFRLRRLLKVNIEGVMIAAGQNLKRLIKHPLGMLFSFLKFPSSCFISPLILTFSTGCNIVRTIFTFFFISSPPIHPYFIILSVYRRTQYGLCRGIIGHSYDDSTANLMHDHLYLPDTGIRILCTAVTFY